jgi:hypothetical protein
MRLVHLGRLVAALLVVAGAGANAMACAVGQGTGNVTGAIVLPVCDKDLSAYDMGANFFAGEATGNQLLIRIQQGGGFQEYADSLTILVHDVQGTLAAIDASTPPDGQPKSVTYDVELERLPGSAPWVPVPAVQMSLSLRGTCGEPRYSAGDQIQLVMHAISGKITFTNIFNGDINTRDTNAKRISGSFENVHLVDPREGDASVPDSKRTEFGTISGSFSFFYQRGGPAQNFP